MTNATRTSPAAQAAETITAASAQDAPVMDKIIVAIHGIGSQLRSDTIRSVARRFGDRSCPPLPVMPLGYFNLGSNATVRISRLEARPDDPLARIGFAEIFWADIPEQVVKANDTLEETKAWGRTVVSRAEAEYGRSVPNGLLRPEDFQLGIGVVDEVVETVGVLENLLAVLSKMGLFKFELAPLLRDYVGDVQLVTDFPYYRQKIIHRFHSALAQILSTFAKLYPGHTPEIYIVAHSEGTVISFIGLLQALSGRAVSDPDDISATPAVVDDCWIQCVRGYMTIGSPIDKHIVLWPALWKDLVLKSELQPGGGVIFADGAVKRLELARQIQWRNYYDLGDPIGFQLDTAMALLASHQCQAFDFDRTHDYGFSRYWLPGKAHNDYWQDAAVFGHFIDDVVLPTGRAVPPQSRLLADKISLSIPYALTFLLHFAAIFLLYKAVTQLPAGSPPAHFDHLPMQIALLSVMLMSITVAARLPRLVKIGNVRWLLASLTVFLIGAGSSVWFIPIGAAKFLGDALTGATDSIAESTSRLALFTLAFIIAASGWLVPRRHKLGRRWLIGFGSAVIATIIVLRLLDDSSVAPIWPVTLAGAAFLYLWWLGILLFDLTFVWHRYIRRSVALETLRQWTRGRDAQAGPLMGLVTPAPPSSPQVKEQKS
ncbi:MAG: MFS transporter [Leptothrix sp. (in: b-proteobacteria)]